MGYLSEVIKIIYLKPITNIIFDRTSRIISLVKNKGIPRIPNVTTTLI